MKKLYKEEKFCKKQTKHCFNPLSVAPALKSWLKYTTLHGAMFLYIFSCVCTWLESYLDGKIKHDVNGSLAVDEIKAWENGNGKVKSVSI